MNKEEKYCDECNDFNCICNNINDHKEPSKEEILNKHLDNDRTKLSTFLAMDEFADAKVAIKTKALEEENYRLKEDLEWSTSGNVIAKSIIEKLQQHNTNLIEALEEIKSLLSVGDAANAFVRIKVILK